jgi:cytochrome c oxidase subunit 3
MWLFLISLGILFAASLIGYLVVRARAEAWPPPGNPELPRGLWVSTIVLLISSGTMHWALTSVRRNRQAGLIAGMLITTLLGGVFLVSQGANWYWLISINATVQTGLYMFTFYVLTALHALHILGGLIFLATVTAKSFAGRYTPDHHPGVTYAAMYWHFLDVVWLIMFVLMFLL